MQHSNQATSSSSPSVFRHLILLIVGVVILAGLYAYLRNLELVVAAGVALLLAHLLTAAGVLYLGRGFVGRLIRWAHAPADHGHSHSELETEGMTLSWAALYDFFVGFLLRGQERKLREATLKLARIQPGEKVLDVGCGTGTLAILAKKQSPTSVELHGQDASPQMIARAQHKATQAGVNVDFRPALVEAIDAPDNSFDLVLSSLMVHHLPGDLKAKAFAEIYRVLKPRGRVLIVDFEPPTRGFNKFFFSLFVSPMMQIDNRQVLPLLEKAGFEAVEMGNSGHPLASFIAGVKPQGLK